LRFFPIFLDLAGRPALVVGAGEAASRKAEALARAGAEVRALPRFDPADLAGCAVAIGADAGEADLVALSTAARQAGIPVNIVDRPALCSFIMPAIVDRAPVTIAISTGGTAPVLARLLRARIEVAVPPGFGRLAAVAGSVAAEIRRLLPDLARRRQVLERGLAGRAAELVFAGREDEAREALLADARAGSVPAGFVHFVGAGPGEADLLTLRAQRVMGEADLILHDAGVPAAVIDVARRDAGRAVATADALVQCAAAGQRVVRLVAGDPGVACVAEAPPLRAAGIGFAVVPGLGA
jgi:uroporphyrin-III C-methyltransferase/precorrin-2 dehydrogenase/sirohydrochlorin ferrochelatase